MKKVKLIFELCFIFVLPLLIIAISIKVNINKTIEYDSNNNPIEENSNTSIDLSNLNWVNTQTVNNTGIKYVYYTEDEFDELDQTVISNFKFNVNDLKTVNSWNGIGYFILSNTNHYIYNGTYFCTIQNIDTPFMYNPDVSHNTFKIILQYDGYYCSFKEIVNPDDLDYELYYFDNFWIKEVIDVNDYTNSNPIYNLMVYLENQVGINTSSDVTKIINYYNCLWMLMWLCWHLIYGVADLFVHIFDKKELDINR